MATNLRIEKAARRHAHYLANHLRHADEVEVMLRGHSPLVALDDSFSASAECYALLDGDTVMAIGGVTKPTETSPASPWMLCSRYCGLRHFIALRKWALDVLPTWNVFYGPLYNEPWAGNDAHLRWCASVGFRLADPIVSGAALYVPILYDYV